MGMLTLYYSKECEPDKGVLRNALDTVFRDQRIRITICMNSDRDEVDGKECTHYGRLQVDIEDPRSSGWFLSQMCKNNPALSRLVSLGGDGIEE